MAERRRWLQARAILAVLHLCPTSQPEIQVALEGLDHYRIPLVSGAIPGHVLHPDAARSRVTEWLLRSLFPGHGETWWQKTAQRWMTSPSGGPTVLEDRGAEAIQASAIRRRLRAEPRIDRTRFDS